VRISLFSSLKVGLSTIFNAVEKNLQTGLFLWPFVGGCLYDSDSSFWWGGDFVEKNERPDWMKRTRSGQSCHGQPPQQILDENMKLFSRKDEKTGRERSEQDFVAVRTVPKEITEDFPASHRHD
jgi:hypothetical protein